MNNHIQDVCRRFAAQGYVVVSTDLYFRTGVWQIFFGGMDRGIPKEIVEKVDIALEAADVEHAIYYYPEADHGFFCNERKSYHPLAAQDAWHRT
ncbi:hypothetical protein BC351_39530 [Paenibacillus ferrarius]|uniref:Dienelactone hydrolase domain-containing protein n=1 Tax=Paenibacillus ferrarius TaxID=1469647 RepID=A0A1V4H993_9BACL|nr:hypothetical protein BC351_39530 [Paenibacillus ferrarius]